MKVTARVVGVDLISFGCGSGNARPYVPRWTTLLDRL
jgi:hypothetical protein